MAELLKKEESAAVAKPAGESLMRFYADAYKVASVLAKSDLIPDTYKRKPENCMIALELAQRIGASPLMVMQNLYIVHGKPAWSSQFLVACINASGKFTQLRYRMTGDKGKDSYGCVAWAKDGSGELLESPEVTIAMAKAEGWMTKNGSKWQTMPELMLRYRCATLFARTYAPELTMGIQTDDEVIDVAPVVTEARPSRFEPIAPAEDAQQEMSDIDKLQALIDERGIPVTAQEVKAYIESKGEMFVYDLVAPNLSRIVEKVLAENEFY